jgi:hypothetical protein
MTDDTSTLWMIFVLFICSAAVLGALMPSVGAVWIAVVTYPLIVVLTLIGFDNLIHHKQVDLDSSATRSSRTMIDGT